jgi:hypothetical protein
MVFCTFLEVSVRGLTLTLLLLIVAGDLFTGYNALAESHPGAFTVTPLIGYHLIDGSSNIDSAAVYGLSLGTT